MPNTIETDDGLRDLLRRVRTIAVVGASDDPARPSHGVLRFLVGAGYRVYAVNPALRVGQIAGAPVHAHLADVPEPIDMVDVFRRTEAVDAVLDEALALRPRPAAFWMQLGVRAEGAAARAAAHGLAVVMNRCPKIEIPRLMRE